MHAAVAAGSPAAVELLLAYGWDSLGAADAGGLDPVDLCTACMQASRGPPAGKAPSWPARPGPSPGLSETHHPPPPALSQSLAVPSSQHRAPAARRGRSLGRSTDRAQGSLWDGVEQHVR